MVVGYSTLRGGAIAATSTIGIGLVLTLVVVALSGFKVVPIAVMTLLCWVPVTIAAEVMRRTSNLPAAIGVIAVSGLLIVGGIVLAHPILETFWQQAVIVFRSMLENSASTEQERSALLSIGDDQLVGLIHRGMALTVVKRPVCF